LGHRVRWKRNTPSFVKPFIKNSKMTKILFSVPTHSVTVE